MAKKEKILIVEDDFANAVGAMLAFPSDRYELRGASDYETFLEEIKNFKPDIVLSDANIRVSKNDRSVRDFRDEISEVCEKNGIKYIFLTGAPKKENHHKTEIHIVKKEGNEYKVIKTYDTFEKEKEMWQEAYEILKK